MPCARSLRVVVMLVIEYERCLYINTVNQKKGGAPLFGVSRFVPRFARVGAWDGSGALVRDGCEYTGRSILSGFGTTFAFRVNDVGSREYIKNLFGRNIKQQSYMSKVQNRGIAEQLREGYVVEDDDINNLPVGEAIVSAPSGEPFRFKFNLYQ